MEFCENDTYDKSNLDTLPLSEKNIPLTLIPNDRTPIPLKKKIYILQFNLGTFSNIKNTSKNKQTFFLSLSSNFPKSLLKTREKLGHFTFKMWFL